MKSDFICCGIEYNVESDTLKKHYCVSCLAIWEKKKEKGSTVETWIKNKKKGAKK